MLPTDLFQVCNMLTIGLGGNIIQRIERNQFKNCQDLITVGTCSIESQLTLDRRTDRAFETPMIEDEQIELA